MWGRRSVRCNFMIHNGNHQRVEGGEVCHKSTAPLNFTRERDRDSKLAHFFVITLLVISLLFLFVQARFMKEKKNME